MGNFLPSTTVAQLGTDDLDLDKTYAFPDFIKERQGCKDPRNEISQNNFIQLTPDPYWTTPRDVNENVDRRDDKLKVLGMLMDPLLPVHAMSSMLPPKALRLPQWTFESALNKMTAFWRVEPLVVASDVEETFSEARALNEHYGELLPAC